MAFSTGEYVALHDQELAHPVIVRYEKKLHGGKARVIVATDRANHHHDVGETLTVRREHLQALNQ